MDINKELNRKILLNSNIVVSSIDRIKISIEIKNKTTKGSKYSLIPDNFNSLPNVVKHRAVDRGIYQVFKSKDGEECLQHCWTVTLKTTDEEIKKIINKLNAPQRKIQRNNIIYAYQGYTKVLTHYEYRITGWPQKARIIKNKNFLKIELNDVLEDNPHTTPYKLIKKGVVFLIKAGVIQLNARVKNKKAVTRKAYRVMKQIKVSEVEVAFDFNPHFGNIFYEEIKRSAHSNLSFYKYKDTVYWNNSYLKRKDWKYKYYNRSLKDRIDMEIEDIRKSSFIFSYKKLLEYVPFYIKERVLQDDIYRFEITVGRERLRKHNDLKLLKNKTKDMIPLLRKDADPGMTKFFNKLPYSSVQELILQLKANTENNLPNVTQKNYLKQIKLLLIS